MSSVKRVVSFLPSATEILVLIEEEAGRIALGGGSSYNGLLVGRSHECDFPEHVAHLPILTASRLSHTTDSLDIHKQVQQSLLTHNSLYTITSKLDDLQPDLILTQNLCDVCSIDVDSVERTIAHMRPKPKICNLEPTSLAGVFDSILKVGAAVNLLDASERVTLKLRARMDTALAVVARHKQQQQQKSIELLEWLSPIFPGGHWTAEMLQLSGAKMTLNLPNDISRAISSEAVIRANPDFLIVAPCGFSLDTTRIEMNKFVKENDWIRTLNCSRLGQIYLVDGNEHFNRPGPRLVDAFEFLVGLIYNEMAMIPSGFPFERYVFESAETVFVSPAEQPVADSKSKSKSESEVDVDIESCHAAACARQEAMYEDPQSKLYVMTEYYLKKRGTCCGNACRHCPYAHFNVRENGGNKKRTNKMTSVTLLKVPRSDEDLDDEELEGEGEGDKGTAELTQHVLFWSGGKDSLLALIHLLEENPLARITLLTSFDSDSGTVAHQNIAFSKVMDQARHLGLDLVAVPLQAPTSNTVYLGKCEEALKVVKESIISSYSLRSETPPKINIVLAFGDLHIEDIRSWRESSHTNLANSQTCAFPVFGKSYDYLTEKLESYRRQTGSSLAPGGGLSLKERLAFERIIVTAVTQECREEGLSVGDELTEEMLVHLGKQGVDKFGEDGSFHTLVKFI